MNINFLFKSLIILLSLFQYSYASEPRTIKVGAFNNYPGIFKDSDGTVKGFYVDALSEIEAKENIRFVYVYGSWSEALERIQTGEVDILTCAAKTPEREIFMDYGTAPLFTTWGELYTLKSSEINDILEIHGKKIAVVKNDFNANQFISMVEKFGLSSEFLEFPGSEDVFKAVSSGKADAGVVNNMYGSSKLSEFGLRSTGIVFNPFNLYITTAKGKNRELIQLFDKYLKIWKHQDNSVFNQAKQKWLHGHYDKEVVLPDWLIKVLVVMGIITVVALIFILLLKLQVKRAVSKIRQKEMALRKSESHLYTLVQTIPDLVWLKDKDGIYLVCNTMFERFFGAKAKDILGKTDYDFVDKELADFFRENDSIAMEAGTPISNEEWITFADDGHRAMLDTIKTPIYDNSGNLIGVLGIGREITERKIAQDKIQNLLHEKELLLKEVHQRIKNNMNTIKGLLTLQLSAEENSSAASSLRDAESRVQSMIMLYDRLYCTENFRELSVNDYLQPLTEEITGSFNDRAKVQIKTEIEDFILNISKLTPLGIIVNELLTNMMKYAFTDRDSGTITVSASMKENHVIIKVQDDGVGIPESVSFQNTKGFGLELVNMLTEQMGGSIRIERGEGTKFVLEFDV